MTIILDLLLKQHIPFTIKGASKGRGIELLYLVKKGMDPAERALYTIKEYHTPDAPPRFDYFDFTYSPTIELQNLTLAEIKEKIKLIADTFLFDIEELDEE